jgi:hypothetical protein
MKKNITSLLLMACILLLNGCAKKASEGSVPLPFQGPLNPSFETSENWIQDPSNGYAGNGAATRSSGTGFMPTKGSWFMALSTDNSNNWYTGSCAIYQENVDFSLSHTLTFDYKLSGFGVSETVEILFTVNGTITLWSKSYAQITIPTTEKLNETVTLPTLPDKGKFTIKVTAVGGGNAGIGFLIDNIRVQ